VGEITLSFVEYSLSKSVHLTPDIVEYNAGATAPFYNLIIGKQTLHDIGAVSDFKEKTITIDGILLLMRNIVNLQLKPSVTRALRHNTCQAQEPISTQTATKRVIKILDAKYDKADLPAIVKDNCSHLTPLQREKLLSLLLKYESIVRRPYPIPKISTTLQELEGFTYATALDLKTWVITPLD
jgi:hypothetical protein